VLARDDVEKKKGYSREEKKDRNLLLTERGNSISTGGILAREKERQGVQKGKKMRPGGVQKMEKSRSTCDIQYVNPSISCCEKCKKGRSEPRPENLVNLPLTRGDRVIAQASVARERIKEKRGKGIWPSDGRGQSIA